MHRVGAQVCPYVALLCRFLATHETIAVPHTRPLPRFGHCGIFLVPEFKIDTETSPMLDDGRYKTIRYGTYE
jgi:hypothetical protein